MWMSKRRGEGYFTIFPVKSRPLGPPRGGGHGVPRLVTYLLIERMKSSNKRIEKTMTALFMIYSSKRLFRKPVRAVLSLRRCRPPTAAAATKGESERPHPSRANTHAVGLDVTSRFGVISLSLWPSKAQQFICHYHRGLRDAW